MNKPSAGRAKFRDKRVKQRGLGAATKTMLIYIALAMIWIFFSDKLVLGLHLSPEMITRVQTLKGFLFVLVSGGVIYGLVRYYTRQSIDVLHELRAILESIGDGVLIVDEDGTILEMNCAARELLAVKPGTNTFPDFQELMTQYRATALDGSTIEPGKFGVEISMRERRPFFREVKITRPDKKEIYLGVNSSPVYNIDPAKPAMAVAVFRDMSGVRRLEKMHDEFFSNVAHELKTPVTVIKTYSQILSDRMAAFRKDSIEANSLGSINRQCDRIASLIEDMIQISRQGSDRDADEMRPIDLARIASDVAERARQYARKHKVLLSADQGCIVRGDADRIEDVIENLVDNAIKFSPEGGEIRVGVSRHKDAVEVAIEDKGLGIPQDRQSRVTERYYRAHADSPYDFSGMGIGLNLSKQIVIRHGGRFWFESIPGQGSKFAFEIPAASGGSLG